MQEVKLLLVWAKQHNHKALSNFFRVCLGSVCPDLTLLEHVEWERWYLKKCFFKYRFDEGLLCDVFVQGFALCTKATAACTLLPVSFIHSSINGAILFAPTSAVLVLLVPGCVDSLFLASFCCLSKICLEGFNPGVHYEKVRNLWSCIALRWRNFIDLAKIPCKMLPDYHHDHGDNAKSKASVQWLSRPDQRPVVYGNVRWEFSYMHMHGATFARKTHTLLFLRANWLRITAFESAFPICSFNKGIPAVQFKNQKEHPCLDHQAKVL